MNLCINCDIITYYSKKLYMLQKENFEKFLMFGLVCL